jgi:DUF4097 and DUF4098 domain-containing protein YvlB
MSARKIGLLLLLLAVGGAIEGSWTLQRELQLGPEGCRVIGGRFYGPFFSFEQSEERTLATPASRIEIVNEFGDVRVAPGGPGKVVVKLRKVVYRPNEEKAREFADRIELRLSTDAGRLRVETNRDSIDRQRDVGFETHLELAVPADSLLDVRNEHGKVTVEGVAAAEVTSSFDSVSVERIAGDLKLESRHGDMQIDGIAGTLTLSSRHGNVSLNGVQGQSRLDVQHGELVAGTTGPLDVEAQHGAVRASAVAGPLQVRASHVKVEASDVLGGADVETSYGHVRLARIGGEARARVEHGSISAQDLGAGLSAEGTHGGVELERVAGPVEATVDHGELVGRGLARGARIKAKGGKVVLEGVSGEVQLDVERGDAHVTPKALVRAPITVAVRHGAAWLELPETSDVELLAETRRGELHAEAPRLVVTGEERNDHGPGGRLQARLGNGGQPVKVEADGDVTVTTSGVEPIAERAVAKPELPGRETGGEAASGLRPPAEQSPEAGPERVQ